MKLGTAAVLENESAARHDLINVNEGRNNQFCNENDKETVFNVDHVCYLYGVVLLHERQVKRGII